MTAIDLVENNNSLTEDDIKIGMSAALCRCTGYEGIIKAVTSYAKQVYDKPARGKENNG